MTTNHPNHSQSRNCETKPITNCPYCQNQNIIKNGTRQKKHETVQLYFCRRCQKKFTPLTNKHRTYPLKVILDSLISYNRFHTLEATARLMKSKYGLAISPQNISNWLTDFKDYLPFSKMRPAIANSYNKLDIFLESRMFHGQIYHFKYHRAKLDLILKNHPDIKRFQALQTFLERVPTECPHQIFQENDKRSSKNKNNFILDQVKITAKENTASKIARFALQATANNKLRHETLQEFMLVNDSVTVAVEIPIILTGEDIRHFKDSLNFKVPLSLKPEELITGHIDLIQIRNNYIHILDYKPKAKKEKPIAQLTLYALALSRLTGLRLFDFKCAWFDDLDYYEFYPLHVVYKK